MQINSAQTDIDKAVPPEVAWQYQVIALRFEGEQVVLGIDGGVDEVALLRKKQELEMITGIGVLFEKLGAGEAEERLLRRGGADRRLSHQYYTGHPDQFLKDLIAEARLLKSSDIHIETYEHDCRVRIRVDGMLVPRYLIEKQQYPSLINKIKISANLDIAEKRLPQDGRIFYQNGADRFDIRVSFVPTLHGEKVVLRLLSNDASGIRLAALGFSDMDLHHYQEGLKNPCGIILISGPTGSGKTTTLYATLKQLNQSTRNILTIEDPIEYTLEGVNQVQVKESIGLTFAIALRTFLRQDPDVIMLGEIRDADTANMAIRAALTGHLVLSTIHTNSAWGTVSRLADMNIPPFLIANTLNTSVAQRLLRLLCPACKRREPIATASFPAGFSPRDLPEWHYLPGGCSECFQTGYSSRKAIYEVIPIDRELSEEIKLRTTRVDAILEKKGIRSLSQNAYSLFKEGKTSLEEIYPVLLQ